MQPWLVASLVVIMNIDINMFTMMKMGDVASVGLVASLVVNMNIEHAKTQKIGDVAMVGSESGCEY